ncbi:MAG TPA: electron transfer flavoprotein subunit alpha/FixB family protein, partial [Mycobacteriales bacterium]
IAGVDAVVAVRVPAGFDPDTARAAVAALIEQVGPDVVLLVHSIRSASFAAGLAAEAGLGFVADVVQLRREDDAVVAVKPVYGGKVMAELDFPGRDRVLVLVRSNVWEAAGDAAAAPAVTELDLPAAERRVRHVEYRVPESGVDLKRADVVLAVGRGVGAQENIGVFAELAEQLGAVLGASRPLVDAGWLPPAHQVGQTGVTVKPKVYVAFGISGAIQHLAGMQSSKTIIAVNTDEAAPIFNVADVGAVADINEVAEQMMLLLSAPGTS